MSKRDTAGAVMRQYQNATPDQLRVALSVAVTALAKIADCDLDNGILYISKVDTLAVDALVALEGGEHDL